MENMKKAGIDYRLNSPHEKVEKLEDGQLRVTLKDGTFIDADKVLVSIGRNPNFEPLQLDKAGVLVANHAIKVDEFQNTNVEGIYAIGDVTNQAQLTPVAIRQGRIVAERIFNNKPTLKMSYANIPTVIFSHPPIGYIGLTEAEAIEKFGADKVKAYRSSFINMFYSPALSMDKKLKSLFKIICHVESEGVERVVGVFAHGKGVDEMM